MHIWDPLAYHLFFPLYFYFIDHVIPLILFCYFFWIIWKISKVQVLLNYFLFCKVNLSVWNSNTYYIKTILKSLQTNRLIIHIHFSFVATCNSLCLVEVVGVCSCKHNFMDQLERLRQHLYTKWVLFPASSFYRTLSSLPGTFGHSQVYILLTWDISLFVPYFNSDLAML
jgi:hypothetical protein